MKDIYCCIFKVFSILIVVYIVIRIYAICVATCIFDVSDGSIVHLSIYEMITCLAIALSYCEYRRHINKQRTELLSEYNRRYCENQEFKKIVKEMIEYDSDINKAKKYFSKNINDAEVIYQRELFIRFFEELQLHVEEGNLEKKQVDVLFSWYAKKVGELGSCFVADFNDDKCWEKFKEFIK